MMPQALFTSNSRMIKFRRVLAVLCFSLLLILVVGVTQKLFERKYSYSKYYDFYQQDILIEQELWCRWLCYITAFWFILVFGVWGGSYDASSFIYFQF